MSHKSITGFTKLWDAWYTKTSSSTINWESYEILKNEPLHDVSNQIKNRYEEMPNHVPKDMRSFFKEIITAFYNEKETNKGAGHRESLM